MIGGRGGVFVQLIVMRLVKNSLILENPRINLHDIISKYSPSTFRSFSWTLPLMFCNKNCYAFLAFLHVPPTSFLDLITIMQDRWNFALLSFLSSSVTSPVLDAVILFQNTVPTYVRHSDPSN